MSFHLQAAVNSRKSHSRMPTTTASIDQADSSGDKFTPHAHILETQDGSGLYGRTLGRVLSNTAVSLTDDVLQLVLAQTVKPDSRVYSIGDYGGADGASSMGLIRDVIALVRERSGARRPVQVLYEDQLSNDFNSLFRRLHGEIPDPPSYLPQFPDVFTMATATNFFQQCAPDNSMDLILNFNAIHWLSRSVAGVQGTIFTCLSADPQARELVRRQAAEDWEEFLLHRAKELKAGGCLVVSVLSDCSSPDAKDVFSSAYVTKGMVEVWGKFKDQGTISQEEYDRTFFNLHQRSPEDCRAPFDDADSAVTRAGLSLKKMEVRTYPSPLKTIWASVLEQSGVHSREEAARETVAAYRTWTYSSFASALHPERTNSKEVMDAFYDSMAQYLLNKPFEQEMNDLVACNLFIVKDTESSTGD